MKRVLSFLLVLLCCILAVLSVSAVTLQSSHIYRSADDSGAYVVRFNGKHADIDYYASRNVTIGLDLQDHISAVCASQGRVILLCDNSSNHQLIAYVYYLNTDVLDSFSIWDMRLYSSIDFGCDQRAIYIENHHDNKELVAYSYNGDILNRYRFDQAITDVLTGSDSIYAVSNDTLYHLSSGSFVSVDGAAVKPPLFSAGSEVIASAKGVVYVLDGDTISYSFEVDTDYQAVSACVIGDRLYYPCGSVVNGYDLDTGERICYERLSYPVRLICDSGNGITAVGENDSTVIRPEHFTSLQQPAQASGGHQSDVAEQQSRTDGSEDDRTMLSAIASDVYDIDFEHDYITGIPSGSTIAEFKSHMTYSGYSLAIYRGNQLRKSGSVGTAMTAVFTKGGSSSTFELAVTGDITGEGNCNSRDLNLLMDYTLGAADFNGVYLIAADVYEDDHVDIADAVELKNRI